MENKPEIKLYRVQYEEQYEDSQREINTVYIFMTDEEYTDSKTNRAFLYLQPATEEQIEAYTIGFEDGVDVATIKFRLEDKEGLQDNFHKPTEEELLDIFREETTDYNESTKPE